MCLFRIGLRFDSSPPIYNKRKRVSDFTIDESVNLVFFSLRMKFNYREN